MSSFHIKILLADAPDGPLARHQSVLEAAGHTVFVCRDPKEGADVTGQHRIDLIVLHEGFSGSALDISVKNAAAIAPGAERILVAEQARADELLKKTDEEMIGLVALPASPERLLREVRLAARRIQLERQATRVQEQVSEENRLVGESEAMVRLRNQIGKAAPTDARVLISGENGTGKELVATAIHNASARASGQFIKVNCAAIPSELIESELFGHEKGAFTGATDRKIGLIEEADGGTLFLDEVGDMALATQAKLLRVLQENEFLRVGGGQPIAFDVRVIAATNKDLRAAIKKGQFRSDLFFRLNVIPISVPPLRSRGDDIALLAQMFLNRRSRERGLEKTLTAEAIQLLRSYPWPGNVRELQNLMERAAIMLDEPQVAPGDLQRIFPDLSDLTGKSIDSHAALQDGRSLKELLEAFEKRVLVDTYKRSKGNVSKMARLLKTDRANLHRKLSRYKIR